MIATISLIDVYGRIINKINESLQTGINNLLIDTKELASGQYLLKVEGVVGIKTEKVLIIH